MVNMCNLWDTARVKKWILSLSLLILAMVAIFVDNSQGLMANDKNSETLLRSLKTNGVIRRPKKNAKELIKEMKLYNGEYYTDPSMAIVMSLDSDEWLTWYYDIQYVPSSSGILVSDQCVATWAYSFVDTDPVPVVSNVSDPESIIAYFPRQGCDRAYHLERMFLPSTSFDINTYAYDLALWKLKKKVAVGDPICDEMPIYPAPISCDRDGPPPDYEYCYAAAWGPTNASQDMAQSNIRPNRVKVKTMSFEQCEAARNASEINQLYAADPNTEVCIQTLDGTDPTCYFDFNFPLICKYWKPVSDNNQGWGWNQNSQGNGWNSNGWNSQGNGWNSNSHNKSRWVVVGQASTQFGYSCEGTEDSAARILRFGASTFTSVFGDCGLVCSSELPHGYECKEKWDSRLGPVYCTPRKINHHSNGWKQ